MLTQQIQDEKSGQICKIASCDIRERSDIGQE